MPSTSTLVDSIYTRRVSAGECYPPDLVKIQDCFTTVARVECSATREDHAAFPGYSNQAFTRVTSSADRVPAACGRLSVFTT